MHQSNLKISPIHFITENWCICTFRVTLLVHHHQIGFIYNDNTAPQEVYIVPLQAPNYFWKFVKSFYRRAWVIIFETIFSDNIFFNFFLPLFAFHIILKTTSYLISLCVVLLFSALSFKIYGHPELFTCISIPSCSYWCSSWNLDS